MTLRGTLRILVSKWYLMVAGLLLSVTLAGGVYALVPAQYTSTGVAVLVQPRRPGTNSNPLLNFDPSLSTSALVIVQALDTPQARVRIGIVPGVESYTVEQAGTDAGVGSGQVVQPFITVKTKAATSDRSVELVSALFDQARQDLTNQQKELRVLPQSYIRLQVLGYASPPKRVMTIVAAATGAALLIGLWLTVVSTLLLDRWERGRARRRSNALSVGPQVSDPRLVIGLAAFAPGADGERDTTSNGAAYGPATQLRW